MTVPTDVTPGATMLRSGLQVAPPSMVCDRSSAGPPLVVSVFWRRNRCPALSARSVPSWGAFWTTFHVAPSSVLALRNVLSPQDTTTTSVPSGSGWTAAPALDGDWPHSGYGAKRSLPIPL